MILPNWLLLQVGHRRGSRHAKMKHWVGSYYGGMRALPSHYQHHPERKHKEHVLLERGNLNLDEYRFWIGSRGEAIDFAKCRYCGEVIRQREARKLHQRTHGCTVKLVAVYKLLLRTPKCVVCDKATADSETRWGIPMHDGCRETWMFAHLVPQAVTDAVAAAKKQGLIEDQ